MTKTTELSPEAMELKRKYQREYRKKNPDKAKQYINNYWERQAQKLKEQATTNV